MEMRNRPLTATGGSGTGGLTYNAGSSTGCSVALDQLTVTNASGNCAVTAIKAADDNYLEITSAPATVNLHKATATVASTSTTQLHSKFPHLAAS